MKQNFYLKTFFTFVYNATTHVIKVIWLNIVRKLNMFKYSKKIKHV